MKDFLPVFWFYGSIFWKEAAHVTRLDVGADPPQPDLGQVFRDIVNELFALSAENS